MEYIYVDRDHHHMKSRLNRQTKRNMFLFIADICVPNDMSLRMVEIYVLTFLNIFMSLFRPSTLKLYRVDRRRRKGRRATTVISHFSFFTPRLFIELSPTLKFFIIIIIIIKTSRIRDIQDIQRRKFKLNFFK